ncbi:uncharacterized protein LOC126335000 isoform X2 [Schistocerca gregaria]|uniref:uncharacterized protein LOC126335000 isoform X2 n=1 Tax=Schistocerca gregaria TaxID=7010 RepID=UPI00211E3E3B|nr:uncharacterized protein LOC126335000 isoform X2 [Schistocerca gregaria]
MFANQRVLCVMCAAVLTTAAHVTSQGSEDRLWEEMGSLRVLMSAVAESLEKFNTLYLGKLEHRMVTTATTLSSIDSNVKNLQERAHVWDTFQLHVAAWNEQINILHKKVDILSRGQERLETLDVRLSQLQGLEAAVERVSGRVDSADRRLMALTRAVERRTHHGAAGPLLGEFASRGVLSTLRLIERKVDRLQNGVLTGGGGGGGGRRRGGGGRDEVLEAGAGAEERGRYVIRCQTPAVLEELLRDVASKVDVIFDKVTAGSDLPDLGGDDDDQEPNNELRHLQEHKVVDRLWRRLTAPLKRTARALEAVEATVGNATAGQADALVSLEQCCAETRRVASQADQLVRQVEAAVASVAARDHKLDSRLQVLETRLLETCAARDGHNGSWQGDSGGGGGGGGGSSSGRNSNSSSSAGSRRDGVWVVGGAGRGRAPPDDSDDLEAPGSDEPDEEGSGSDLEPEPPFLPTAGAEAEPEAEGADGGRTDEEAGAAAPGAAPVSGCEDLAAGAAAVGGVRRLGAADLNEAGRDFRLRYCHWDHEGRAWTVIQRRGDYGDNPLNFTRTWDEYRHGFGDLDKEFWFGNDFLHRLTHEKEMMLRIELEAFDGRTAWAEYNTFRVAAESQWYRLSVTGYRGNASDSFSAHNGVYFSTVDNKQDQAPECCPCARSYGGGWWFYSCFEANLNGVWFAPGQPRPSYRGIIWQYWLGDRSLRRVTMMIRPRDPPPTIGDSEFEERSSDDVPPIDIPEDP